MKKTEYFIKIIKTYHCSLLVPRLPLVYNRLEVPEIRMSYMVHSAFERRFTPLECWDIIIWWTTYCNKLLSWH